MLWQNLKVTIQYPVGSVRSGISKNGQTWSQRMPYAYGEIGGTKGIDNEPVDIILGPNLKSTKVFVIKMPTNKSGEDKCMVGFLTAKLAKKAFISCYGGDVSFFESLKSFSVTGFIKALNTKRGKSLSAGFFDGDTTDSFTWGILQPLPTGWNTKVENPGDKKLTKEERDFNTEISRRQGPEKTYVEVSQGADINVSPPLIYSSLNKRSNK